MVLLPGDRAGLTTRLGLPVGTIVLVQLVQVGAVRVRRGRVVPAGR